VVVVRQGRMWITAHNVVKVKFVNIRDTMNEVAHSMFCAFM